MRVTSQVIWIMFIKRVNNLQRTTVSNSQIMRITLLMAVISVDCRNGIKKVDIRELRGEILQQKSFLCEKTLVEDG
jgi:hypothetical protein